MRFFEDSTGRRWSLEITASAVERIRELKRLDMQEEPSMDDESTIVDDRLRQSSPAAIRRWSCPRGWR